MANDREVLRLIWDGKIPLCFTTDPKEIVGMQSPEPMFLMVSRLTYLPLVTEKVTKHFNRYISNEHHDEVWFECNGRALKWNCPIGILYDLFGKDLPADEDVPVVASERGVLPWTITIHFGNAPADQVLRCPNREVVEAQFMSALKEADFLKHRGQIISTMQKKDHSQLWLGLINDKFDQFWAVNRRLMESVGEQESFKSIPVRCYNPDGVYTQKLVSPVTESGTKMTLRDLLNQFSTERSRVSSCLIHGIHVDPETPLQWLSEHLSYPDNFLHICLLTGTGAEGGDALLANSQHDVEIDSGLPPEETATEC